MKINWFRADIERLNIITNSIDSQSKWESLFPQLEMTKDDLKPKNFFGEIVNYKNIRNTAISSIEKLKKSFVFNVPLNLSILLTKTKPDIIDKEIHLPYDIIYINSNILEYENFIVGGVFAYKENEGIVLKTTIREMRTDGKTGFITLKIFIRNGETNFNTILKDSKETIATESPIEKKVFKSILTFFFNFVDFLNNPEIEFIKKEDSIPSNIIRNNSYGSFSIIVTGKLKIYLDKISEVGSLNLIKAHWVRGHWMRFRSERYKNMKGKKTWVYPFIKGFGNPNKKEYYLKQIEDFNQNA